MRVYLPDKTVKRGGQTQAWIHCLLALVVFLSGLACAERTAAPQAFQEPGSRQGSLERQLSDLAARFEQYGFSGAVLVAQGNKVLLHQAYGVANQETGRPFTVDTRSEVMSITKPFVATAILALEAQSRLTTEDPLEKHLGQKESL